MRKNRSTAKALALPLPTRAMPITLLGLMAAALCAAVVASQVIAVVSQL
jgi:hypothetical protein